MRFYRSTMLFIAFMWVTSIVPCRAQEAGFDKQVKKPVSESIRIRQDTQKEEVKWRDEKAELTARYDALVSEAQQLTQRKAALAEKRNAVKARIAAKRKQLTDITQIQSRIVPLITTQIAELKQHLDDDLPFLPDERHRRLQRLAELRDDPGTAASETFRRVMEALLVEAEYGNTVEVYRQTITIEGQELLVDIFRLGRMALFFQSLDHQRCGFYNVAASAWQTLASSYNSTLQAAMDMGAKRRPVEMLTLPVGRLRLQ
jgi:hypothetical protein